MALSPWDHSSHAITLWVGQSGVVGVDVLDLIDGTVNVEVVDVVRIGPNTPSCLFRPKLYWVVAQPSWFYSPLTEGLDFDSHDEKANTCTWLLSAAALTKLGFENWPPASNFGLLPQKWLQEPKRCCQSRFFDVFFDGHLSPVG